MTIINNSIFRACSRRPAAYEYMTRDYVSVQEGASVREAMRSLVRQAGERENVSTIYVVDAAGVLTGSIELARLIRAREGDALASVTEARTPRAAPPGCARWARRARPWWTAWAACAAR